MDLYSMRDNPRLTAWLGAGFIAAMLAVVALVLADFNQAFTRDIEVTANVPRQGAVVAVNSAVHFRGVEVGRVIDKPRSAPGGEIQVRLRLDRERVADIPDSVRVVVGPLSIFGNQYVNLVTEESGETQASSRPIEAGATIPAVSDARAPSLQSNFVSLNDLLHSIHPAQLNAGLSGLAQALAGRGDSIGDTLVSADEYLTEMLDLWPVVVEDLKEFGPFATVLAQATPEFLDLLRNVTVSAETVVKHREDFASLMGNGGEVATQVAALIRETMGTYADAVAGAAALFDALSQGPLLISKLLTGIDQFAQAWAKTMHGGSMNVTAQTLRVTDPAYLALALASGENVADRLERAIQGRQVNPPTYTLADCPQWGSVRGNCASTSGGGR